MASDAVSAATDYPYGSAWLFDIGEARIEHRLLAGGRLHYRVISGEHAGVEATVPLSSVCLRPGLFLVWWREPSGIVVVHTEDFDSLRFNAVVTFADGSVRQFAGTFARLEG